MTYLNIILTLNTIVLSIIAFALCFITRIALTYNNNFPDEDHDSRDYDNYDDDDEDWKDCLCKTDVNPNPTPKTFKCSREFGFKNE